MKYVKNIFFDISMFFETSALEKSRIDIFPCMSYFGQETIHFFSFYESNGKLIVVSFFYTEFRNNQNK